MYITKLDNLGASGAAGSRPMGDVPFKPKNSAATLIFVHSFSAAWINELRGNATRFMDNALSDGGNTVNYGIPYDNIQDYPPALQFGVAAANTTPANFAENTYEVRDTVSHTFGTHTVRAGVELRFEQDNDNLYGYERPTYAFDGLWTFANDAPVFEAVAVNPANGGTANSQRYFRSQNYAFFVQHDWKVTPNFTLNTGLRWEEFTPLDNKGSQVNDPVLGPPGTEMSGMKMVQHNHLWLFQHNNFGPKIGFAYTPAFLNAKVVVRGGFAIAYNHLDIALFNNMLEDGPGIASFGLCCATNNIPGDLNSAKVVGISYALGTTNSPASYPVNPTLVPKPGTSPTNANGFPSSGCCIEVYGVLPNLKAPSSDLFSLEVQRSIGAAMTATIGYAGASGHHYARLVNQPFLYNQANTPVFAAYFAQTDSTANYHSLNVQLRRPMRNNISYSFVYTYAKSMDEVSNGDGANGNANQTNPANNASEYGPSDYDMKHHVTATGLYQTPTFHTHNSIADALVNGFQINGTFTWHTGLPWTPITTNLQTVPFQNGAATQNVVRPIGYNGQAGDSCSNSAFTTGSNFPNRTQGTTNVGGANYFTTILPPKGLYTPGIGRNSFRGPCYTDVDMSLAKEFAFGSGDHHNLFRIQANIYNVFNQLELQPLGNNRGNNIADQYFGFAQGADAGRNIELLGRIQF
jgi:hypothetical protein